MLRDRDLVLSRRTMMIGTAATALTAAAGLSFPPRAAETSDITLVAAPTKVSLGHAAGRPTDVWAYNGSVPGPTLRVRQGEHLRVVVENRLPQDTSVHWHGLRIPNAMDGAPPTTQKPIAPGERFVYEFTPPDAGTFWYHPHVRSSEQVDRGLAGALIVEERSPIKVDRDVTWVLDDWRLLPTGAISPDFKDFMDASHNGRLGNWATINGASPQDFAVAPGERIRLRLINVANARIFGLAFAGHDPKIVAIDGQPIEPHAPDGGRVVIAPAMRVDLVIDMMGAPGARFTVSDTYYGGREYDLVDIAYRGTPVRTQPLDAPVDLPFNPLSEPNLATAERLSVVLGGGMMSNMRSAVVNGRQRSMQELAREGIAWAINGVAAIEHQHEPMFTLKQGRSYVLAIDNDTAWIHPMHLHGHSFRVVSRNGRPVARRVWQDTVLIEPRDKVEIAFVADNPGDWMFHCHILEHQAAGMDTVVRVSQAGGGPADPSGGHDHH